MTQIPLVAEMTQAFQQSIAELRSHISDVQSGKIVDGVDTFTFWYAGKKYIGFLRGRNAELVVGINPEGDKTIAVRTMLDGHTQLL